MLPVNTIILGNGFDLDLGLKTSYRDFLKSNQFRTLLDENCGMGIDMNIFQCIKDQSQLETWGGVEASLLDFVQKFKTCPNQKIKKAHPTFRVMRQSCSAYSLSLKYLSSLKPYALRFITFILLFIPSTLAVEI